MPLFEVNVDFKRIAAAVERIADCLERAYPPPTEKNPAAVTADNFHVGDEEELWRLEEEADREAGIQSLDSYL